jgi:hypothetical protein
MGGRKVWGEFPFFESAFVGGSHTVAGYHSNRFAGDASLYGGALVRLTAGAAPLALPAIWGVFGNFDLGRVYVDGDSPGGWHTGGGGGALARVPGSEEQRVARDRHVQRGDAAPGRAGLRHTVTDRTPSLRCEITLGYAGSEA